jgi:hypothetical protein
MIAAYRFSGTKVRSILSTISRGETIDFFAQIVLSDDFGGESIDY